MIDWRTVVDRWPLVVADFHRYYGIDLEKVYRRKSWRWFEVRVLALLSIVDSLIGRSCDGDTPPPNDNPPPAGEELAA